MLLSFVLKPLTDFFESIDFFVSRPLNKKNIFVSKKVRIVGHSFLFGNYFSSSNDRLFCTNIVLHFALQAAEKAGIPVKIFGVKKGKEIHVLNIR